MPRLFFCAVVFFHCVCTDFCQADDPVLLQASDSQHWYRGNLHTHSLWSDGDDYPENIALWYREHGYDFLCFTDHNILHHLERWIDVEKSKGGRVAYDKLKQQFPGDWVEERMTDGILEVRLRKFDETDAKLGVAGEFLLIQGEEITDRFKNKPVHMNVSNIAELIPPAGGESIVEVMQNNVRLAMSQRNRTGQPMLIHLNHPNFGYAITAEQLAQVEDENFFEVYNGHPGVHNSGDDRHASTERIWDIVLTQRLASLKLPVMYGIATDDGHNYHKIPSRASEPGRGWVNVLCDRLTPGALIEALEAGRFYASSGVELEAIVFKDGTLSVSIIPDDDASYTIEFIGTRQETSLESEPVLNADGEPVDDTTRLYSDEVGAVLKTVSGTAGQYEFQGDELYVRARITSSKPHANPSEVDDFEQAWTQPIVP